MTLELKDFDGDLDWLGALEQSSFNRADQLTRDELAEFQRDPANRIMLIVQDDVRIGAMLLTITDAETMYLESMAIHKDHRSTGCGGRALSILLARLGAEGFRCVHLHVRLSNPSRRLYERVGFTVTGEVPGFYTDGESAWHMQARQPRTELMK